MTPTEPIKLTLQGKEYNFLFTLPRLREACAVTRRAFNQLAVEAISGHVDALCIVAWAGLAGPHNPKIKTATVDEVAALFELRDVNAIVSIIPAAITAAYGKPEDKQETDPPNPAP